MKAEIVAQIKNQIEYLKSNRDWLVIDADTHASSYEDLAKKFKDKMMRTPDYYQGRPINGKDLMREMDVAKVDMALVWQNPATTVYSDDQQVNFENLLKSNQFIYELYSQFPKRFIAAGWTDPKALGVNGAIELVEICTREFGFPIVKMNPAQNAYPIDSDMVFEVVEAIIKEGAVPAFHYGADTIYTPAKGLEKLAAKFSNTPILAVHMGGGGASYHEAEKQYHETRQLGLFYPNIKYILSAKRDTHIESDLITYQLAGAPFSRNIFCASDAPYGNISWNYGGFRALFNSLKQSDSHPDSRVRQKPGLFDDHAEQNYLGRNFADFAIECYSQLLKTQTSAIEKIN